MSKNNTTVTIRMDKNVKEQAQEMFNALGLSMSTAIDIFMRQCIMRGGLPFEIKMNEPNPETIEAIKEVEYMKAHPSESKGYTDVDLMMKELLS